MFHNFSRASPQLTLDMDNSFARFCPTEDKKARNSNARQAVLDNFKEISRIMTQNFLQHKKLEARFNSRTAIPRQEKKRMQLEEDAQQRMTNILKKMHSPSNFTGNEQTMPGKTTSVIKNGRNSVFGGASNFRSTQTQSVINNAQQLNFGESFKQNSNGEPQSPTRSAYK